MKFFKKKREQFKKWAWKKYTEIFDFILSSIVTMVLCIVIKELPYNFEESNILSFLSDNNLNIFIDILVIILALSLLLLWYSNVYRNLKLKFKDSNYYYDFINHKMNVGFCCYVIAILIILLIIFIVNNYKYISWGSFGEWAGVLSSTAAVIFPLWKNFHTTNAPNVRFEA